MNYPNLRPFQKAGLTLALYNTYTTIYDSRDPSGATGGHLPDLRAVFHARAGSGSAANMPIWIEIRHMIDAAVVCVEHFSVRRAVSVVDADGSDFRLGWGGVSIVCKGNRLVIAAAGAANAGAVTIDFSLRWGVCDYPPVTHMAGFYDYVAAEGAQTRARIAMPGPYKNCVFNAVASLATGVAQAVNVILERAVPLGNAISTAAVGTVISPTAVDITAANETPGIIIGGGADAAVDQMFGYMWIRIDSLVIPAVTSGRVFYAATFFGL